MTRRKSQWRTASKFNGRVRLHLRSGQWLWQGGEDAEYGYKQYSLAHNLTRWQAFRLGLRPVRLAATR